jgi:hypothetical protein
MNENSLTLRLGPYAEGPAETPLLGRPVADLEASRLFSMGGVRMRRMTGGDRLYVGEQTDYLVHLDEQRRVVAVVATLLPPDQDVADEYYHVPLARPRDGGPAELSYQWAMLVYLAHEVLGLGPGDAAQLLENLYRDDYLPRSLGGARLSFVAGRRFHGDKALCLLTALPGEEGAP